MSQNSGQRIAFFSERKHGVYLPFLDRCLPQFNFFTALSDVAGTSKT
jgi:hypothetical protein